MTIDIHLKTKKNDLSTTATGSIQLAYGLPESDAIQMCRHRYTYELAKLTIIHFNLPVFHR